MNNITLQRKRDRKPSSHSLYVLYVKRFLDVILAFIFILLFWWLYIIVAVLVRVNLGSPVLFVQERPGKIDPKTGKERIFKLYKFRTMTDKKDSEGNLLPDSERLTRFGKILRSTSLDEIPEIINVLRGDMSLIGPRPLLVDYLDKYNSYERRRHEVRPGLTGLAQVSGRNTATWKSRFERDVYYVDYLTMRLDAIIFILTIKKILWREDIEFVNDETIHDYFNSNNRQKE